MKNTLTDVGLKPREKAILVSVVRKGTDPAIVQEHLDELALLLDTAGADSVMRIYQERQRPNVATALGKGKVEELLALVEEFKVEMVVFDDDLTPVQTKNLEEVLLVKVLDRCGVILDIFASHAMSVEAKTQVELAQLEYLFPRLTRMWTHLSKQFGGVGTKGPGETQIETDRRMNRSRMSMLRTKLDEIEGQRVLQRSNRKGLPRIAIVGYTNAGKSSLLRALTDANVYVEDKLFATLDTTVRSLALPNGRKVLLSDTVGFIRKLPPQLVASFRSTLSETTEAELLLHVVDISHAHARDQIDVVVATLDSIGAGETPTILVCNKIDAVGTEFDIDGFEMDYPGCIFISASRGINLEKLLALVEAKLAELSTVKNLLIPYDSMKDVNTLYKEVEIIERVDSDNGIELCIKISPDKVEEIIAKFQQYFTETLQEH
ncbi:MAG: GTPase HflX [Ignavibacteria bacterium]|nr:GTPase HflX [Ignavibacteria bacterium]